MIPILFLVYVVIERIKRKREKRNCEGKRKRNRNQKRKCKHYRRKKRKRKKSRRQKRKMQKTAKWENQMRNSSSFDIFLQTAFARITCRSSRSSCMAYSLSASIEITAPFLRSIERSPSCRSTL